MPDDNTIRCPTCDAGFPTGRHLGGHAKTHNRPAPVLDFERMLPYPECFADEDDWRFFCEQTLVASEKRKITRRDALAAACASCTLEYQTFAQGLGVCHPPEGAMTPLRLREEGLVGEDDD